MKISSKFIPISSLGDINTSVPINKVAKEGVFTSTLEHALLNNDVDIAVHSFKDLPTQNPENLEVVVVLKRNNPSDTLIIREDKINIISKNIFEIKDGSRIGTGSARRQSQLLHSFPGIATIDIRGNVETRIKKLLNRQYDGIIMASAVFQRLQLDLPEGHVKIELDTSKFPSAPAQGAICIQMKKDNEFFDKIKLLDDLPTRNAVEFERNILLEIGSGCQLPLGLTIINKDSEWKLSLTLAPIDWRNYNNVPLTRFNYSSQSLNDLFAIIKPLLPEYENPNQSAIENKDIILIGSSQTTKKYEDFLLNLEANVRSLDLQQIFDIFSDEQIKSVSEKWLHSDWLIITSKNSINALNRINKLFPKQNLKCVSVGFSTTKSLQKNGYAVHFQAESNSSLSLIEGFQKLITKNEKLFYISAKNSKPEIMDYFTNKNYDICEFISYNSEKITNIPELSSYDYAILFSPTYAKIAFDSYGEKLARSWIAIGESTQKKLQSFGLKKIIKPDQISMKGLVEVLQ